MKRLLTLFLSLAAFSIVYAQTEPRQHTVERGETIESIAKHYGVTPDAIIKANPLAAEMFFAGTVLTIPDSNDTASQSFSAESETYNNVANDAQGTPKMSQTGNHYQASSVSSETNPANTPDSDNLLDHWYLNYCAPFKSFDTGYYGIGWINVGSKGWGATMSINGNWGLGDGNLMFEFGPVYAYKVNEYLTVSAPLRGFIYTYDKFVEIGKTKFAVNGGITLTPTLNLTLGRILIGFGYELGWANGSKSLYHDAQLTFGYRF